MDYIMCNVLCGWWLWWIMTEHLTDVWDNVTPLHSCSTKHNTPVKYMVAILLKGYYMSGDVLLPISGRHTEIN
jgi:hypothetical protein